MLRIAFGHEFDPVVFICQMGFIFIVFEGVVDSRDGGYIFMIGRLPLSPWLLILGRASLWV